MRIVMLCSSVYSETACAMAVHLAESGYVPAGVLSLSAANRQTLLRKVGQLGLQEVANYAGRKLLNRSGRSEPLNPHLHPLLHRSGKTIRSLHHAATIYGFPIAICKHQNSSASIARLQAWSPDLIIFTGGNILRKQLLQIPRLGVLNVHLGFLPEIRGMSSPEWSLLNGIPVGVTLHFMDEGIDTGPVLQRCEYPDANRSDSLPDLRHRLIAFGIAKTAEVVAALHHGTIAATPQTTVHQDNQYFVMHEWLQSRAAERLAASRTSAMAETTHE